MADDEINKNNDEDQAGWAEPTPTEPITTPSIPDPVSQSTPSTPYVAPVNSPKKSKLWLWITLSIAIPVLICIVSSIVFIAVVAQKAKPPIDATNKFYSALQNGDDTSDLVCSYGDAESTAQDYEDESGSIESFDFDSYDTIGSTGTDTVSGTVTRDGIDYRTRVSVKKYTDGYAVCDIYEVTPIDE